MLVLYSTADMCSCGGEEEEMTEKEKRCSKCAFGYYDFDGFWCEHWGYYVANPAIEGCDSFVEVNRACYETIKRKSAGTYTGVKRR